MTLGALPPLTSVDMCLEDVGRVDAELLLAAIGGEHDRDVHTVPSRLAVRESSGGYPAAGEQMTDAGKRISLRFVQGEVREVEARRHHAADQHFFASGRAGGLPVTARNDVLRDLARLEARP
jgi:hypothetical protein